MTDEMKKIAMASDPDFLFMEAELVEEEGSYLTMSHMGYSADELRMMAKWLENGAA